MHAKLYTNLNPLNVVSQNIFDQKVNYFETIQARIAQLVANRLGTGGRRGPGFKSRQGRKFFSEIIYLKKSLH